MIGKFVTDGKQRSTFPTTRRQLWQLASARCV